MAQTKGDDTQRFIVELADEVYSAVPAEGNPRIDDTCKELVLSLKEVALR